MDFFFKNSPNLKIVRVWRDLNSYIKYIIDININHIKYIVCLHIDSSTNTYSSKLNCQHMMLALWSFYN